MNLLELIAPYREQIKNNANGHGFSNRVDLQKVADVWHTWLIQSDENIYPVNANMRPIDMSCNDCIKKMLQLLWAWINILEGREENKPKKYKAIKEKTTIQELTDEDYELLTRKLNKSFDDQLNKSGLGIGESVEEIVDLSNEQIREKLIKAEKNGFVDNPDLSEDAKIAHMRQELDDMGIKYHHKQKPKSLDKLIKKHRK